MISRTLSVAFVLALFALPVSAQTDSWTGSWNATYGELRLIQSGKRVYGDYANVGIIDATYDSRTRRLSGTFNNWDQNRKGSIDFTLSSDGTSFTGNWGWGTTTSQGSWTGSRTSTSRPRLTQYLTYNVSNSAIDRVVLDEVVKQNLIGVAVAVIENGEIKYTKGYGYSDLARKTKMTDNTVLRWASISKTLTAVTVLQLQEANKLKIGDKLSAHVGWPTSGREGRVTLAHLLRNRSGLHHYGKDSNDKKKHNYDEGKYRSDRTGYNGASALGTFDHAVDFEPGSAYRYSTFGFNALGSVVDKQSPEGDYVSHVQKQVASKVGATFTVSKNYMTGYLKECDGRLEMNRGEQSIEWKLPGGGWQSSVKDLAKFAVGLMNGVLLDDMRQLWNVSDGNQYAFGVDQKGSKGDFRVWHAGDHDNAATIMHFFPNRNIGVVLMSNTGYGDMNRIAGRIYRELYNITMYNPNTDVVHNCVETKSCTGDYSGVWRKTGNDVVLRRGYQHNDFATEWEFLRSQGYVLVDFETYKSGGDRLWDGVFKKGSGANAMWRGFDFDAFNAKWTEMSNSGQRLIDLETYMDGTQRKWAGVFRKGSGKYAMFRNLDTDAFGDKHTQLAADGYQLIDIEPYHNGTALRWAGVWVAGSASLLNRNYESDDFGNLRDQRNSQGWKLIDIETYTRGGKRNWAGVWEKSSQNEALFRDWNFCSSNNRDGISDKLQSQADNNYELLDWELR